jgi:hypothetical protein
MLKTITRSLMGAMMILALATTASYAQSAECIDKEKVCCMTAQQRASIVQRQNVQKMAQKVGPAQPAEATSARAMRKQSPALPKATAVKPDAAAKIKRQ